MKGFDKVKIRQIRGLILFVIVLIALMIYSESVLAGIRLLIGILTPFLAGAAVAFVLNIPLRAIENEVFGRCRLLLLVSFLILRFLNLARKQERTSI